LKLNRRSLVFFFVLAAASTLRAGIGVVLAQGGTVDAAADSRF